ncbi:hypothetical protein I6N95_08675 [Vagococcus sp. BWB3-3]|uniref:Uncharacterized protein n=1 Tax=Vagococcus allomyrinae TaxID=2794353 RepID=A0A940P4V5_9ENTE|nr:hypothetical protein [Vagococcus allomyrinae]MBP1041075.1 hypothetical protein [Vagococcus allomyrinae]
MLGLFSMTLVAWVCHISYAKYGGRIKQFHEWCIKIVLVLLVAMLGFIYLYVLTDQQIAWFLVWTNLVTLGGILGFIGSIIIRKGIVSQEYESKEK